MGLSSFENSRIPMKSREVMKSFEFVFNDHSVTYSVKRWCNSLWSDRMSLGSCRYKPVGSISARVDLFAEWFLFYADLFLPFLGQSWAIDHWLKLYRNIPRLIAVISVPPKGVNTCTRKWANLFTLLDHVFAVMQFFVFPLIASL